MADISISGGTRPKATLTASLPVPLLVGSETPNDTNDNTVQYVMLENVAPNPSTFTAVGNTTNGSSTISSSAAFASVKVGDAVSGSGIAGGSRVTAKASDSSITLNNAATGAGTGTTLTFTPPTYDVNIFGIVKIFTVSGSQLSMNIKVYRTTGAANIDSNADGADESTYLNYGNAVTDFTITADLDTILENNRVARPA